MDPEHGAPVKDKAAGTQRNREAQKMRNKNVIRLDRGESVPDGQYYRFECIDAINYILYPLDAFQDEREAAQYGADREADVILYTYENGGVTGRKVIYDCGY